jgi:Spy/CpxP family protein refolding chaperone
MKMKLNKNLVLTALFAATLTLGGAVVRAQDTATPAANPPAAGGGAVRMHGLNLDNLAKQLGLTDDQTTQFKAAFAAQQQKLRALMTDQTLSKDDRRAQAKQLRQDLNTQLQGILTDEQFTKWQKMMAHHHPGQHPPTANAPATNAPAASN